MIEFACPHCNNQLKHADEFAGRDGWCRICKGIISIPNPGQAAPVVRLTPEQRYARLDRLFRHAVTIVDEYRQLQLRLQEGNDDWTNAFKIQEQSRGAIEQLNRQLAESEAARNAAESQRDNLQEQVDILTETLELKQIALTEVELLYETESADLMQLKDDYAAARALADQVPDLREQLDEAVKAKEAVVMDNDALLERILATEQELESERVFLARKTSLWQEERETLTRDVEEKSAQLSAASNVEAELRAQLAEADARLQTEQQQSANAIERISARLAELTAKHSETEDELLAALIEADAIPALESELAKAREGLSETEQQRAQLARELAVVQDANRVAETRAQEAQSEWEVQRDRLMNEAETSRAELQQTREALTELQAQHRETAERLEAQVQQLKVELADTIRTREALEYGRSELEREAAEAKSAHEDALARFAALEETAKVKTFALERAVQTIDERNAEIRHLQDELAIAMARALPESERPDNGVIEEILAQRESEIAELRGALDQSNQARALLERRLAQYARQTNGNGNGNGSEPSAHFRSVALQFYRQEVARLFDESDCETAGR